MSTPSTPSPASDDSSEHEPRDAAHWAQLVAKLKVSNVPAGAVNLNVDGRQVVGPLQGFGPMWQKTYQVRLSGITVTPTAVIEVWKAEFPKFQPPQNRMFPAVAGVQPGQIVLMNATMRGMPVNSGLMVLYADDESFTLMTPEGCPEAGWITCSAYVEDGATVAQVRTIGRSNDPIYEIGFRLVGAREQEKIWMHVLKSLAAYYGVNALVRLRKSCEDPRIQWAQLGNVWQNATVRSMLYALTAPLRGPRKQSAR
ncbi:MAG TPA: hypothetical protein VF916_12950 [Ktedonobacterales bacterium]